MKALLVFAAVIGLAVGYVLSPEAQDRLPRWATVH